MADLLGELKKNYFFHDISDQHVLVFAENYLHKIVEYATNQCIISKDEPSQFLGLVLEGSLGIYSDSQYGDHTLIGLGDDKYFFGFIPGFLGNANSITSLYSRGCCKVAYFNIGETGTALEEFVKKTNGKIILNMFAMLSLHIRNDFDRMHIISSPYVKVRYVSFLLNRYAQMKSLSFSHRFTRTELASYLGVYRTSLSRVIKEMVQNRLIDMKGNEVTIIDLDSLLSIVT